MNLPVVGLLEMCFGGKFVKNEFGRNTGGRKGVDKNIDNPNNASKDCVEYEQRSY